MPLAGTRSSIEVPSVQAQCLGEWYGIFGVRSRDGDAVALVAGWCGIVAGRVK